MAYAARMSKSSIFFGRLDSYLLSGNVALYMSNKLDELRSRIDQLDQQLLDLISARARCASEVGALKRDNGENKFYRPEREATVLRRIADNNPGPLSNEEMVRLFREMMSACLALEQPLCIAFLGPVGTYTEEATLKHFGHSVETKALSSIDEVFREVESGAANYGVVPIENSTEGMINYTLDKFMRSPLKIVGEVELPIHHCLLSKEEDISKIRAVYSHQQSLAQCRKWLDSNLSSVERKTVNSNAKAALIATQEQDSAAVASSSAAVKYKLNILARNIEDRPDNSTRFLIIGDDEATASGNDKTSLLVSAPNEAGSLYRLLEPFAKNKVSMTRIQSRPSMDVNWEYVFFLDLDGHVDDQPLQQALNDLQKVAEIVNVLGSYPKAIA